MNPATPRVFFIIWFCLGGLVAGVGAASDGPGVGQRLERRGDEIIVCGQLYHTSAPVVLWIDPGGYDAYRLEPRFVPLDQAATPPREKTAKPPASRFSLRRKGLTELEIERVRGGGWDLPLLQTVVDQFVIHYDAVGTSGGCFEVLHDIRGLSIHFMLDLDGTIYQTLDVKEEAWHATVANGRSIGIEIANLGAYPPGAPSPLDRWYQAGAGGLVRIVVPDPPKQSGLRDLGSVLRPARDQPVIGNIQGQSLRQYDFTDRQYESLIRLTATLCKLFPRILCDYPRDAAGVLVRAKLADPELVRYQGILGHYHVQANKVDPGPAFQWDRLIKAARDLAARPRN
jgi:N-acetyl-anhydromuramyl-L-alanine amidase AmpD